MKSKSRYDQIIAEIFRRHFKRRVDNFSFDRSEIEQVAADLKIKLPKNIGDLIYSYRFRSKLPSSIADKAPPDKEWMIELAGSGVYRFRLGKLVRVVPRNDLLRIKIPDATPEIINRYALSDEQALLAKVRYNRLIDVFLGITAYSLQNHLRTTVKDIGQIETDEVYVGVNRKGTQFVIPVQAKGGKDQIGVVQTVQDVKCCEEKFPSLVCRAVSVQFMEDDIIAMFELALEEDDLRVMDEKHYKLVPADEIKDSDLKLYRRSEV
jgi:hypothetical protein